MVHHTKIKCRQKPYMQYARHMYDARTKIHVIFRSFFHIGLCWSCPFRLSSICGQPADSRIIMKKFHAYTKKAFAKQYLRRSVGVWGTFSSMKRRHNVTDLPTAYIAHPIYSTISVTTSNNYKVSDKQIAFYAVICFFATDQIPETLSIIVNAPWRSRCSLIPFLRDLSTIELHVFFMPG